MTELQEAPADRMTLESSSNGQLPPARKPAARKAAKKPAKKPAKAKKAPAKDRSAGDAPASERRAALVKLLRKMGADNGMSAVPISKLAGKLGYNPYDVYCLAYHKFPLAKGGFVKTTVHEDSREQCVYLTAKGAKVPVDQLP